ncbi:MAG: ABC transporter ATP-binding protein [Candidatus Aenigmarchaeota archaeon]|nr:ABC transporter ATP-binding protein [Candidatus Aenigmarchaeota archaeon]
MVIEAKDLSFSYPGKHVLRDISLTVERADFLGITGSTGSGKTTLAMCFNGLIPKSVKGKFSGSVSVMGADTRKSRISDLAKKVGFVFQDPDWQLFSLTVRDEVSFGLQNLGMKGIDRRVRESLRMVGLSGYEGTEPHRLSQGQKQKLCIASVLAMEPEIIILDEPTSQLDYRSSMNVYGILRKLNESGKTVIVIEHNTDLLAEYANKVLLLDGGRAARLGQAMQVLSDKRLLGRLGVKLPWVCMK